MSEPAKCELCGEPMPAGEEMFKFHGYSGPCPKSPLPDTPFASEPAEYAFQAAKKAGATITRDQFRLALQVWIREKELSQRRYEEISDAAHRSAQA